MIRSLAYRASAFLGLDRLARACLARRLLVLCYHGVCGEAPDVRDPDGLHVPVSLFRQQLEFLVRHYRPVSLEQVRAAYLGGAELPPTALLLTFDDGYRNVLRHALPVLRSMDVPSVVFPVAGAVAAATWLWTSDLEWQRAGAPGFGELRRFVKRLPAKQRRLWLAAELVDERPRPACDYSLAGWDELTEAAGAGLVAIGSHGLHHEPLTTCDEEDLREELERSRLMLCERLNVDVDAVAYPNGDCSPSVAAAARQAGYKLGFTTVARHARRDDDPLQLPRILVGRSDQPSVLGSRLSGWQEWLRAAFSS